MSVLDRDTPRATQSTLTIINAPVTTKTRRDTETRGQRPPNVGPTNWPRNVAL